MKKVMAAVYCVLLMVSVGCTQHGTYQFHDPALIEVRVPDVGILSQAEDDVSLAMMEPVITEEGVTSYPTKKTDCRSWHSKNVMVHFENPRNKYIQSDQSKGSIVCTSFIDKQGRSMKITRISVDARPSMILFESDTSAGQLDLANAFCAELQKRDVQYRR